VTRAEPALRAVLFDAAGTLLRLREPVGETYARFFAAADVTLPAARLDDAFARVLRGMPPMVFPDARGDEIRARERDWWREVVRRALRAADGTARLRDFDACFGALFAHYASAEAWQAMPGAREALDVLAARGLRLGIVSNFDHRLRGLLRALDLADRFTCVVLPGDAAAAKPDPRIFAVALEALHVAPQEAVYVGDDPDHDHAGAAGAGLRSVDVRGLATFAGLPELLEPKDGAG
jgi:putative hydrolase of the HAD superfamily